MEPPQEGVLVCRRCAIEEVPEEDMLCPSCVIVELGSRDDLFMEYSVEEDGGDAP